MENVSDEQYIALICNGEFDLIPDFSIGELFESFFDNINYNLIKEDGKAYVYFSGEATCDDEPCTVIMKFLINDEVTEFEVVEVKVNDEILKEDEIIDLLEDIAYVGGAILEDDGHCDESSCAYCSACEKGGMYDPNEEDEEDEDDDEDFDDEIDDDDENE